MNLRVRNHLTVCSYRVTNAFKTNPHSIVAWMSRNFLLEAGVKSEVKVTSTGLKPTTA